MGINFIVACHDCREQHTMMRGDEAADLQEFYRRHARCFDMGPGIPLYADCNDHPEYTDPWTKRGWLKF